MNKKVFDVLRVLQIIFPALGALYAALAGAWGLPYADPIGVTCAAITAFIGVILKIDSNSFFKDKEIVEVQDVD